MEKCNGNNFKRCASNSAFHRMTAKVPVFNKDLTIGEIYSKFQRKIRDYETINYVYIIDNDGKLAGVFSIKELFKVQKSRLAVELMKKPVVIAHPHTHQERVAILAIDHNLKAIPVVDKENRFLGVVPSDTILEILHNENIEDFLRFAGIHKFKDPAKDIIHASAMTHFQKRLPWLLLGLLGGMAAALVVGVFEAALETQVLLAAFIPTVVYIADAVGTQTQTIFIRSIAIEQKLNVLNYITREAIVSFFLAIVLGLAGAGLSILWKKTPLLGAILGISIFMTTIIAAAIAIALPWLFLRFKSDPAIASGPFATAIRDVMSIIVYFLIATEMINQFI